VKFGNNKIRCKEAVRAQYHRYVGRTAAFELHLNSKVCNLKNFFLTVWYLFYYKTNIVSNIT